MFPVAALVIPLTGTGTSPQYSVNLFWNSSSGVVGYNVYRSTAANGTYSKLNSTLDANTAYSDATVVSGQTYYYAATSVNSSGQESTRSTPPCGGHRALALEEGFVGEPEPGSGPRP